jgi:RNA polymerase sigma factor (sigma-70 family)
MLGTSDTDLRTIERLRQRDEAAFRLLYQAYYPMVERLVTRNSGTTDDARDLFQDTLLVLVSQMEREGWSLTASLKTYLYAIAQRQWLARLREQARSDRANARLLADLTLADGIDDEALTREERVTGWLNRITEHCQRLLRMLFLGQKNLASNGYKNANTARNQQYKCLQQVRRVAGTDRED